MCPLLSPDIWGDVSARTPDKQFLFLADPSKRSSYVPFGISMLINLLQTEGAELLVENTERETRGREKEGRTDGQTDWQRFYRQNVFFDNMQHEDNCRSMALNGGGKQALIISDKVKLPEDSM